VKRKTHKNKVCEEAKIKRKKILILPLVLFGKNEKPWKANYLEFD
jgi:hypothetical protein